MSASRPAAGEYAPFFQGYVARVPEEEILPVLEGQVGEIRRLAASVPAERETFRYAPEKWSVREVFGHLGDTERLFGYRAMAIARGGREPLAGFDENASVTRAGFDAVPLGGLEAGWAAARRSNVLLLRHLPAEAWTRTGTADGKPISVRALAWILAGHVRHHQDVFRDRYGLGGGA
ncbi:MAG: DinB family protein [Thermoanaerobaculia bacterium]